MIKKHQFYYMKFIAIEKENAGVTEDNYEPFLFREAEMVWSLYKANIIREIYFDADRSAAVIILECESRAAAEEVLSQLPLVANGLIRFDLMQMGPYTGFDRLMK